MADLDPFDRQEREILLRLVRAKLHAFDPNPPTVAQLRDLETKLAREHRAPEADAVVITIAGAQGEKLTVIARGVLELLQGTSIRCSMPEEAENPYDGDSIEQLGGLSGVGRVIVQTRVAP